MVSIDKLIELVKDPTVKGYNPFIIKECRKTVELTLTDLYDKTLPSHIDMAWTNIYEILDSISSNITDTELIQILEIVKTILEDPLLKIPISYPKLSVEINNNAVETHYVELVYLYDIDKETNLPIKNEEELEAIDWHLNMACYDFIISNIYYDNIEWGISFKVFCHYPDI